MTFNNPIFSVNDAVIERKNLGLPFNENVKNLIQSFCVDPIIRINEEQIPARGMLDTIAASGILSSIGFSKDGDRDIECANNIVERFSKICR